MSRRSKAYRWKYNQINLWIKSYKYKHNNLANVKIDSTKKKLEPVSKKTTISKIPSFQHNNLDAEILQSSPTLAPEDWNRA
jgi:hypothetical protein